MYIQRIPPGIKFTRMDNAVIRDANISDGAFRLYAYLIMVPPSINYDDQHLMSKMAISQRTLTSRKLELKKADLLCIEQIGPRIYHAYMGDRSLPASAVKRQMKEQDLLGKVEKKNVKRA